MRLLLFISLIISTITTNGQNHLLGIKGGPIMTEVKATNFASERNFRTGMALGLTYDFFIKENIIIGADFLYNERGFTIDIILTDEIGNPTGDNYLSKFYYDYITLPIKVGVNYGKTISAFTKIGLTPSLLIDAETIEPTIIYNGTSIPGRKYNVTDRVNRFDIGGFIELGGGYMLKDKLYLYSSIIYQHSLTSLTNSNYFPESKIRHYGLTINIGLNYSLTNK